MNKLNSRQHRFVLNLLSGMSQTDAYIKAGYNVSREVAQCNASQLVALPKISTFLDAQEQKALAEVQATIASPTERKQVLTELLRAQLVDFQNDAGEPELTKQTPHARAAREYYHRRRIDRDGNPVVTKNIKLVDPIAAIQELNKMDGSYAPSRHLVGHANLDVVFTEEKRGEDGKNTEEH